MNESQRHLLINKPCRSHSQSSFSFAPLLLVCVMHFRIYAYFFPLFYIFSFLLVTVEPSSATNNQSGIVQVLETELWDEANQVWKTRGERWTNLRGQLSASPSEMKPPDGFEYEGEWKIVVSSGDSMGWEYQFQYLRPPKRKRTWLRSLKQSQRLAQKPTPSAVSFQPKGGLARSLSLIRDDFNFKGFGFSLYKSLLFPSSVGVSFRLPLTMNFDTWDRHPELPNVSTNVSFNFPWEIGAVMAGSVHLEWVKWVLKCVLQVIPRLIIHCIYEVFIPFLWMLGAALVSPTGYRLPPMPKAPKITISKPRYDPEISERIGGSVSYQWSQEYGLEWRVSYWHSYLPTLAVLRKLLRMNSPVDWWQKHFGSIGLSTSYPTFSCSGHLCLSGLYFQKQKEERPADILSMVENEIQDNQTETAKIHKSEPIPTPRLVSTTKAGSLT